MGDIGHIQVTYSARGLPRYEVEVRHRGLNKLQVMRGAEPYIVAEAARLKLAQWEEQWQRKLATTAKREDADARRQAREEKQQYEEDRRQEAQQLTELASRELAGLERILEHTLNVNDAVQWERLKNHAPYAEPPPRMPALAARPQPVAPPREPTMDDPAYEVRKGFFSWLFPGRLRARQRLALEQFDADHAAWQDHCGTLTRRHEVTLAAWGAAKADLERQHQLAGRAWKERETAYRHEQANTNAAIDADRAMYEARELGAVLSYCYMVLENSEYPDCFPRSVEMDFTEGGVLVVDFQLPALDDLPKVESVRWVKARDELEEKMVPEARLRTLYDVVLYQVALRTLHELFEADTASALTSVAFNGHVTAVDPADGKRKTACVMSVQTEKAEFESVNLASVDPKACFKKLKGVCAARLHSLTPIAPLLQLNKKDDRFVSSYAVAETLEEGENLAAMDWEDFEHLIREVFEREFAHAGGEVKVTRASRDGGVDAVVFDPDPLRGGRTVIQAKRYTNTVTVAAVRELYGAVVNEGANKGILVTTSDFGPDAHAFARDKPLVLISGSNLLHLLRKHGHRARIDLKEAKQALRSSTG